jgi:DNA-binding NarL/FixJ family response regulator
MRAAHDVPVAPVLAVDDHAAFLGAVRAVVGSTSGSEVVAEAQSALQEASASCGALASAWARFGRYAGQHL